MIKLILGIIVIAAVVVSFIVVLIRLIVSYCGLGPEEPARGEENGQHNEIEKLLDALAYECERIEWAVKMPPEADKNYSDAYHYGMAYVLYALHAWRRARIEEYGISSMFEMERERHRIRTQIASEELKKESLKLTDQPQELLNQKLKEL